MVPKVQNQFRFYLFSKPCNMNDTTYFRLSNKRLIWNNWCLHITWPFSKNIINIWYEISSIKVFWLENLGRNHMRTGILIRESKVYMYTVKRNQNSPSKLCQTHENFIFVFALKVAIITLLLCPIKIHESFESKHVLWMNFNFDKQNYC